MRIRDQVLLVYLGAIGTILGIALGTSAKIEILLCIPYLALGVSILVSQHNAAIGALGDFCGNEIQEFLDKLTPSEAAPQWDNSNALKYLHGQITQLRSWGHLIIVSVPCLISLGVNWNHLFSSFPFGIIWWFAITCTIIGIFFIAKTHLFRNQLYQKRKWYSNN